MCYTINHFLVVSKSRKVLFLMSSTETPASDHFQKSQSLVSTLSLHGKIMTKCNWHCSVEISKLGVCCWLRNSMEWCDEIVLICSSISSHNFHNPIVIPKDGHRQNVDPLASGISLICDSVNAIKNITVVCFENNHKKECLFHKFSKSKILCRKLVIPEEMVAVYSFLTGYKLKKLKIHFRETLLKSFNEFQLRNIFEPVLPKQNPDESAFLLKGIKIDHDSAFSSRSSSQSYEV